MKNIPGYSRRCRLLQVWPISGAILLAFSLSPPAAGAGTCDDPVARVVSVQGIVEARRAGETAWTPVNLHETFCPGDGLSVRAESRSAVMLTNGTVLRLDEKSTVTFTSGEKERSSFIDLLSGTAYFFSRLRRSLKVTTPFVNANVEGTEFVVRITESETLISVFTGQVTFANAAGSITLIDGQSAAAAAGRAPASAVVVNPRDAVQWALYYPPLQAAGPGTSRASELLAAGRIDEARSEIERALASDPEDGRALSLQSVILTAQNKAAEAGAAAGKALAADPRLIEAHLALSYARQAMFDLEGTRDILVTAVAVESDNALVRARLAEVHLSFGNLDKALEEADRAATLAPDLERTQTVLGFAHLTRSDTSRAKEAFEKAIRLDQASPLPRLGLGLAMIRDGDLEEGRELMEVAVSLDPGRSLLRSYLGKAFYEEKLDELAMRQYGIAEELDPMDPTPLFYSAIQKQSLNRPVEALRDLQQSIALNDNRAIFRSRLLLDDDLAARSASLARIYRDLGFQQTALAEGWRSLNTDPGNFSAHRFLADSYSTLPRHEIARVSELLQSQLLQPLNITPLQPNLAESNLLILDGAGPSAPAFNEFSPLFLRDRLTVQASGVAGGNDTLGDELVLAGIQGRFSYSAGQFHYETDGSRENNDLQEDIYNVFAQVRLAPRTGLQAEYRYRDTESGDLALRFDRNDFFPELRQHDESHTFRIGLHHEFSPHSDLIVSAIYKDSDSSVRGFFDTAIDNSSENFLGEIQHIFSTSPTHIITGAGYSDRQEDTAISDPFGQSTEVVDTRHANFYLYSLIHYPRNVTTTLGGSVDLYDGDLDEREQFNPKLGISWNPSSATTVRAAAFRVLTRTLVTDQTVEPTQVAGFNQFFNDVGGTSSWRYGVAVDQRFTPSIFGGVEFSRRDLEVPFFALPPPPAPPTAELQTTDWEEKLWRAYLDWAPHPWFALSGELHYEDLTRESRFGSPGNFVELRTITVTPAIGFFHPSGLNLRLETTYVDQKGEFGDPFSGFMPGEDHFWIVDAAVGYRLPQRRGLVTVEVRNLFDEGFSLQEAESTLPRLSPERLVLVKMTLSF